MLHVVLLPLQEGFRLLSGLEANWLRKVQCSHAVQGLSHQVSGSVPVPVLYKRLES